MVLDSIFPWGEIFLTLKIKHPKSAFDPYFTSILLMLMSSVILCGIKIIKSDDFWYKKHSKVLGVLENLFLGAFDPYFIDILLIFWHKRTIWCFDKFWQGVCCGLMSFFFLNFWSTLSKSSVWYV